MKTLVPLLFKRSKNKKKTLVPFMRDLQPFLFLVVNVLMPRFMIVDQIITKTRSDTMIDLNQELKEQNNFCSQTSQRLTKSNVVESVPTF